MPETVLTKEKKGFTVMVQYPEFLKLFTGQLISRLGDSIDSLAMMWMAYKLTDSPFIMATVMFFNALPSLLFGVLAGVFVDRWDRKKILIFGDISRGIVVAAIAYIYFTGNMVAWYLYISSFVISTIEIFASPARTAVLPTLIKKEHLMTANSMFNLASSLSEIVGVGLASMIVGFWGIATAILIDALSFWFCALMTLFTRIKKLPPKESKLNLKQYHLELKEGFQFIRTQKIVFICILLGAFTNFTLSPIGIIFPIFSDKILNAGSAGFAIMSACFSAGVFFSSIIVGQFGDRVKKKSPFILLGIAGIGLGFILLSFTRNTLTAGFFSLLAGSALPVASISFSALVQQFTPQEKLGRVSAFSRTLTSAGIPLGIMLTGLLAEEISANVFFCVIGILVILISGITSLSKDYRKV